VSPNLTGTGGSITDDNTSAHIGEWEITRYTSLAGFSGWRGKALLKRESCLVGTAQAVFEMDGKTYHGSVIVNHNPHNWSRCAVTERAIISFRGDGELIES
jgi:hypothetical protein